MPAAIDAADLLIGLGEVAVTVAGFSGIVAVLGVRSVAQLSLVARARLVNLLVTSLAAAFLSFLPVALQLFDLRPALVWRISSCGLAAFCAVFVTLRAVNVRRLGLGAPDGPRIWVAWTFVVALGFAVLAQAANVAGLVGGPSGGPYVLGILALLLIAGLQFALLVLDPVGTRRAPPGG